MRNIFLLFALLTAGIPAFGQHLSIGASASAGLWLNRQSYIQRKEAFAPGAAVSLRYFGKSKWSFSAVFGMQGRYDENRYTTISFEGKKMEVYEQYDARLYSVSLMLQRCIFSATPKTFEHLVGLMAGCAISDPGLTKHVTLSDLYGGNQEAYTYHGTTLPLRVWSGFGYELHYHFRPRFEAIFSATAEADVWRLFNLDYAGIYEAPYSRFSSSIGVAYTLY